MNKLVFVLVCLLVFVCLVPVVSAGYVCPAAYQVDSSTGGGVFRVHPSSDAYASSFGMAFTANASAFLYDVSFKVARYGSPTCEVVAVLYAVGGGVVGTNGYPVGSALAVSVPVNVTDLSITAFNQTWLFDGSYELQLGSEYVIVLQVTSDGGLVNTSHYLNIFFNNVGADASKNYVEYKNDGWATNVDDVYFVINGDTEPYVEPTPTPMVTVVPEYPMPDPFVAVPSYYMVLLVLFAVVAVLAGLYVMFEREGENKAVALLFGLVGLVIFVILIVGYFVGF